MKKTHSLFFVGLLITSFTAWAQNLVPGDIGAANLSSSEVRMTVITEKGFVNLITGSDWSVVHAQGSLPVAGLSFKIPIPGSKRADDSAVLAFFLIQPKTERSKEALAHVGKKRGPADVKLGTYKDWKTYTQKQPDDVTESTIVDATKSIADVTVHIVMTWPHLKKSSADEVKKIKNTFEKFLDSVTGDLGKYRIQDKDVFRRQNCSPGASEESEKCVVK